MYMWSHGHFVGLEKMLLRYTIQTLGYNNPTEEIWGTGKLSQCSTSS